MRTTPTGAVLKLLKPETPTVQCPPAPVEPKIHPAGVWDLPSALGYRRLTAIFPDGNVALEINMSDRVPESVRLELKATLERSLELSLRALKI